MGHLFALAGPSGVGKTTFLNRLHNSDKKPKFINRATTRPPRPGEIEGIDYNYYLLKTFLHKLASNDFLHIETVGNYLFGIEKKVIEECIYNSNDDAIIMAGMGATHLKELYGKNVTVLYMYSGTQNSMLNPECLEGNSNEIDEIKRRLSIKYKEGIIEPENTDLNDYVKQRMDSSYIGLAYFIGKIRNSQNVIVLENLKDELKQTINNFYSLWNNINKPRKEQSQLIKKSFVLMPFRKDLNPVFEDHIKPVIESLGFDCQRADCIFSNNSILDDVINAVNESSLIISDLTDCNPNVFYETGYCHAIGKKVILLTQDNEVPFDLRSIRHIKYSFTPRGMKELEDALSKTVKSII